MKDKKNILLVDDDSIANFLNERIITAAGLANEIYKALNGQEALSIFNQYINGIIALPEVVLLDINMPIMNGFEFVQAFQQLNFLNKEKVLIIILSSSNNPKDVEKASTLGIKHYIIKPISAEKLKFIIDPESPKGE